MLEHPTRPNLKLIKEDQIMADGQFSTELPASNLIAFPDPDDIIPTITGIDLLDADPAVIARRLRRESWEDRAQFFNNIVVSSIQTMTKILDYTRDQRAGAALFSWGLVEMTRQIGRTLDLWDDAEITDVHSAMLFSLSLNPDHQTSARLWLEAHMTGAPPLPFDEFFDCHVQHHWKSMAVFYRMIRMSNATAAEAWRCGGVGGWDDDWLDPDKVAALRGQRDDADRELDA